MFDVRHVHCPVLLWIRGLVVDQSGVLKEIHCSLSVRKERTSVELRKHLYIMLVVKVIDQSIVPLENKSSGLAMCAITSLKEISAGSKDKTKYTAHHRKKPS
jgi:hypothetical protein